MNHLKTLGLSCHTERRSAGLLAAVLVACLALVPSPLAADGVSAVNDPSIEELIEGLGAREYAQREKARAELQQLGVAAFEALHAAQYHPDVEIRKQAEYLLRAIRIVWTQEVDPDEVKQLLRRYEQDEYDGRLERLEQLGQVEAGKALPALCRLARFETSEVLSKRAALTVMNYAPGPQQIDPELVTKEIRAVIGASRRTAVSWLRAYANTLEDPEGSLDDWRRLAAEEVEAVRLHPDKDRLAVVQDLLRWQIEWLQRAGRDVEMLAVLRQLLPLQGNSREELLQMVDWLLDRRAWSLIDDLVTAFPEPFRDDPFLLYRRAEAAWRQERIDEAQALAAKALEMKADDEPFLHVELGVDLQSRGLIDWAEQEYRRTLADSEQGTHPPVEAAIRLGWMFHDLSRNHEAYEAFKELVDLMEKDKNVVRRVQELNRVPIQIQGQMHFSHALDLADRQKWDEHRAELEEALKYDRENADILIAMYRVPQADDEWRKKTERRVELLREHYAQQVSRAERDARAVPGPATKRPLAQALNQYAWLVSNTTGDYQAAVRSSLRSLELIEENAGYLDTLGRCYFAVGDYETALKHQRRAAELEPHTGQIRRQLELFETTVRERGPGTPYRDSGT